MVSLDDIRSAADIILGAANRTPVLTSRTLNRMLRTEVFLKCENLQRVGAFKFRGAYHALSRLSPEERRRGVITHSSGNHAQALALAARLLSVRATVVMPSTSPRVKVSATRDTYGAEVVLCENTLAARQATAERLIAEHGFTMIPPYDDDRIIAGAGTAALELMEEVGNLDLVAAPVGGGGLLSGTATAVKGLSARTRVYGVEPERADDAFRSLAAGAVRTNERTPDTIADGLRTNLSERTFEVIRRRVDEIVTVTEAQIVEAMRFLWERVKLVVEPSGSVPLAGLLSGKIASEGRRVGLILSGGNVDLDAFFSALRPA